MSKIFERAKNSHFIYIALLLCIAIVGFWQISFLKYSVTHDMINCWIPWRYYISQCFQNHEFPFWNPYQHLGYPIHADLQGPTWYLESILLSITTGQTNYTLHFLFIFYVFLAGTGMYFLSLAFQTNKTVAFITGVSYMLGGFFVAHVQHFYAIIGAAWLPFIILNYYKMLSEKSYKHAVYTAIFMFFNLTGGNHTFSIILIYLFATLLIFFIYQAIKEKNQKEIIAYIKLNALFGGLCILLASVVLVAFYQTAPYIERLSGMSYKAASNCPLSPQSLISFLLPFSTVNSVYFFNTDQSMCNVYVGGIAFLFFIAAIVNKKTAFEKTLLVFALICLLASFGAYTPVHKFLFNYFPLINRFRFPSYFSLFTIIILLLLGSKQMSLFIAETNESNLKKIKTIAIVTLAFLLFLFVFSFIKNNGSSFFFTKHFNTIFEFMQAANLHQNIILQSGIQLLLIGVFIAIISTSLKKYWLKVFCLLAVTDMFIATQLNVAYVGFSQTSPKELHDYLATLPQNFPTPPQQNKIIENTEQLGQKHGLYLNTSGFHKRISASGFNSYIFKNYETLTDSLPYLFEKMQNNKLLYFSKNILPKQKTAQIDTSLINNTSILLNRSDFNELKTRINYNATNQSDSITIVKFAPNSIKAKVTSSSAQLLTLLQSNYVGWTAQIDNKETKIYESNYLTMSVLVPEGEHEITFEYKNKPILIAGAISYSSFFILLIVICYLWIKSK
ncbi:MAG: YfhO family protein [Bacteroidia bacterium]